MTGASHAGKSTLLSMLVHGHIDNGRGSARKGVFRHPHELLAGHTSAIAHELIGFTSAGELVNYDYSAVVSWQDICEVSAKVIHFIDTAGAPRYLKTTLTGLVGHAPDYGCVVVPAVLQLQQQEDYLTLCGALDVPFFVVLSKVDLATRAQLVDTLRWLYAILKNPPIRGVPLLVQSDGDVSLAARSIGSHRVVPIFFTCCVRRSGASTLVSFLNLLPKCVTSPKLPDDTDFAITEVFEHPQAGTVLGGVMHAGFISPTHHHNLMLGPIDGVFQPVTVTSVHRQRVPTRSLTMGQTGTLAINLPVNTIRRGMVIIANSLVKWNRSEFSATLTAALESSLALKLGSTKHVMLHFRALRTPARIELTNSSTLSIRLASPEYVPPGHRLLIVVDSAKIVATVDQR